MLKQTLVGLPKIYPVQPESKDVFFVAEFELGFEERDLDWLAENDVDPDQIKIFKQVLYYKQKAPHFFYVLVYKQTKRGPEIRVTGKKIRCSNRKLKYRINDPLDEQLRFCLAIDVRLNDEILEKELLKKIELFHGKENLIKEF